MRSSAGVWRGRQGRRTPGTTRIIVLDLRPRRDDGRPFHARQRRLLRPEPAYPADRPRPTRRGIDSRLQRPSVASPKPSTSDPDRCSICSDARTASASRRPFADAVSGRQDASRLARPPRIGSSISELDRRTAPKPNGLSAIRLAASAISAVHPHGKRTNTCTSAAACPPLLFDLKNDPGELHQRGRPCRSPAVSSARLNSPSSLLAWRAEHLDQSLALVGADGRRAWRGPMQAWRRLGGAIIAAKEARAGTRASPTANL